MQSIQKKFSPPKVLTPRVNENFSLKEVSTSFVCQELSRLQSTKATGQDNIPTKLLKDAAPIIVKPIAHLINRTILTSKIPSHWKEAKVIPIFKAGKRRDKNNSPNFGSFCCLQDHGACSSGTIAQIFDGF